jgi:glycine/D-amino acid oxidase-like deaminating enzyme
MTSYDAIIAGGGIVGAACAAEFIQAGMRVALVEPRIIGGGATAAGMGHIAVMDDSEAQFALTRYSQLLWKELAERLPADVEYVARGAIWVAADDEEMTEVYRKQRSISSVLCRSRFSTPIPSPKLSLSCVRTLRVACLCQKKASSIRLVQRAFWSPKPSVQG